jgi:2-polyprenyl-3-methyl-5-hydroxy-6-metoxy-1,4-benzoquinol methylase
MKLGRIRRKPSLNLEGNPHRGRCFICGDVVTRQIEEGCSLREARCPLCGGSRRNSDVAKAIVKTYLGDDAFSLAEAVTKMKHLSIYEAQASGPIHECLRKLPNYHCSEYFDNVPIGSVNECGVRCENLTRLFYAGRSFDLVITQDVLEHVDNPERAFLEIYRVLKSNGCHIFTIPLHEGRKTMERVKIQAGERVFILPPVYHGDPLRDEGSLVYTDFGEDMLDFLESLGLPTEIIIHEKFYSANNIPFINDESTYESYLSYKQSGEMLKYFTYNSVVFRSTKKEMVHTLKADGERFLPWMEDPIINYEHLHRYGFAKEFAKGKKVLDLACGEGYGSAMLAEEADDVIGIDINEAAIKHASRKYAKGNLRFMRSSMTNVMIKGRKIFDVIICFEALEHIEEHKETMAEVERLLKDGGIFIVSMPNRYVYSDQPHYKNPRHKKELYLDEFETLLKSTFNNVLVYGQKVFPASNIFPMFKAAGTTQELAIEKDESEFSLVRLDKKQARYLMAIASNHPINAAIGSSYLVDASGTASTSEVVLGGSGELEITRRGLKAIHNFGSRKLLMRYYKFRDKIFPHNTKRRAYARRLKEMARGIIRRLQGN